MRYDKTWWEQDQFWGYILIIAGIAAIVFHPFDKVDDWLHGETDYVLTALMIALAAGILFAAFYTRPTMKALLLLWIIAP